MIPTSSSLTSSHLTAHEHVVAVAVPGICRVWHGIEGSDRKRELVKDEEVGIILGFHQPAQQFLTRCGQILLISHLNSCFLQHLNCLRELESKWWVQKPEWFMRELG